MEIVTFIIDCLKSLWELLKNPITKRVEKANNKKKNIHIVFTTFNSKNGGKFFPPMSPTELFP